MKNKEKVCSVRVKIFSGKKLLALIESRGWSVAQFAALLCHVAPQYKSTEKSIYCWIREEKTPAMNYLPALSTVLGLKNPLNDLFVDKKAQ